MQVTNWSQGAVPMSNCSHGCQGVTAHRVASSHIVQGLEVQPPVCHHQAAAFLDQGGLLHCWRIILNLLSELHQAAVIKDSL